MPNADVMPALLVAQSIVAQTSVLGVDLFCVHPCGFSRKQETADSLDKK